MLGVSHRLWRPLPANAPATPDRAAQS
jgi:hypothetical protein